LGREQLFQHQGTATGFSPLGPTDDLKPSLYGISQVIGLDGYHGTTVGQIKVAQEARLSGRHHG
jgi:hypothetical protein